VLSLATSVSVIAGMPNGVKELDEAN